MQDINVVNDFSYLAGPGGPFVDPDAAAAAAAAAALQQVYVDQPTPTDATKPALSYPTGGGTLTQWTGSAWV